MSNSEVCAVVVTYNRKFLVEKCIRGILAQENAKCEGYASGEGIWNSIDYCSSLLINLNRV